MLLLYPFTFKISSLNGKPYVELIGNGVVDKDQKVKGLKYECMEWNLKNALIEVKIICWKLIYRCNFTKWKLKRFLYSFLRVKLAIVRVWKIIEETFWF